MSKTFCTLLSVKIFFILLFSFFSIGHSYCQTKDISITEEFIEVNLDDALQRLSKNYQLQFAYNSKVFRNFKITKRLINLSAEEALNKLIENTNYEVKKINTVFVFYPKNQSLSSPSNSTITDFSWSSIVLDYESHEPLPYASILILSNGKGVISNEDGYFSIHHLPSDTSSIIISYVGYQRMTLKLNPKLIAENNPVYLTRNSLISPVSIYGEKKSILSIKQTVQELDVNTIKTLPAVGDQDLFNTVQLLSGIDATGERPGKIHIRGGASDENLILMDGFTLYHIDHFYQLYSTINASAIKHVRIHKGWFEPKFGGRASGIIEIQGKEGNLNFNKTEIGLNFNSANVFFETPLEKSKSSFVFAGRKSISSLYKSNLYQQQFNTIYNQSSPNLNNGNAFLDNNRPVFDYSDANIKFNFIVSDQTKVNFSFFSSKDELLFAQENSSPELGLQINYLDKSTWKNKGYSARWVQKWTTNWFSNLTLGYSNYSSKYIGQDVKKDLWFNTVDTLRNDKTTLLSDFSLRFNNEITLDNHQFGFGLQHTSNKIQYKSINPSLPLFETAQQGTLSTLYFQDNYTWDKIQFLAGIRSSYYNLKKDFFFAPRFSLTYNTKHNWIIKGYYGQNYQVIRNTQRQDLFAGVADIWELADENTPSIKSFQYGLELSKKLVHFEVSATVYQRQVEGALYNLANTPLTFDSPDDSKFSIGVKNIQGLDLQVIKNKGKHKGWISLSLLQVYHVNHNIIPYEFYDDNDQLIEGKIAYTFSQKKWNFSGVFIYGSGKPYTAALGTYSLNLVNENTKKIIVYDLLNQGRLPVYSRLDLSVSRYFFIQGSIAEVGLAFFNVLNTKNTADIRYYAVGRSSDNYQLIEKKTPYMGFTPGIHIKFTF